MDLSFWTWIELHWVWAHVNISGNELAEYLAKERFAVACSDTFPTEICLGHEVEAQRSRRKAGQQAIQTYYGRILITPDVNPITSNYSCFRNWIDINFNHIAIKLYLKKTQIFCIWNVANLQYFGTIIWFQNGIKFSVSCCNWQRQ